MSKICKNNTSGYRGIYWHTERQKWVATIYTKGKNNFLGRFDDINDAVEAYNKFVADNNLEYMFYPKMSEEEKKQKRKEYHEKLGEEHKEKARQRSRDWKRKLKKELIEAYGGKCECCGEDTFEFLTIDHINGGGTKERKEVKQKGSDFYKYVKDLGFPKDIYRLLCYNCNCCIGHYGYCPHQKNVV